MAQKLTPAFESKPSKLKDEPPLSTEMNDLKYALLLPVFSIDLLGAAMLHRLANSAPGVESALAAMTWGQNQPSDPL